MAIAPGTYNMTVQRRSDHSVPIVLKDNTGTAINLTGFTEQHKFGMNHVPQNMQIGLLLIQIDQQDLFL